MKLVTGVPAVVHGGTLVIADIHLGIEREYWRAGIRVSGISRKVREALDDLLEKTRPKKIIIAGDLKHNIPDFTVREADEVRAAVEAMSSYGEVLAVKGNHDGDLEKIVGIPVYPGSGIREGRIFILHGHAHPSEEIEGAKYVVSAHVHPVYHIPHPFGTKVEKCFVLGSYRGKETIILPAFSPFITGVDVSNKENMIGPVAKEMDVEHVVLLDGTPLL